MPKKVKTALKTPRCSLKTSSQKKSKAHVMTVTSHVGRASPQDHAEFRKLWNSSIKNAKKKVIRDGPSIITIYK
mgnify:CR=1 FL=1